MSDFYQKHIFICENKKKPGKKCCGGDKAEDVKKYLKEQLLKLESHDAGKIRVSASGCLGRCGLGPCIVIYPEGIWFSYETFEDIDKIIEKYLVKGEKLPELEIAAR